MLAIMARRRMLAVTGASAQATIPWPTKILIVFLQSPRMQSTAVPFGLVAQGQRRGPFPLRKLMAHLRAVTGASAQAAIPWYPKARAGAEPRRKDIRNGVEKRTQTACRENALKMVIAPILGMAAIDGVPHTTTVIQDIAPIRQGATENIYATKDVAPKVSGNNAGIQAYSTTDHASLENVLMTGNAPALVVMQMAPESGANMTTNAHQGTVIITLQNVSERAAGIIRSAVGCFTEHSGLGSLVLVLT